MDEREQQVISKAEIMPNEAARARRARLVDRGGRINELADDLHVMLSSASIERWARGHYGRHKLEIIELLEDLVPLYIFAGDVGTGKSATAAIVGQALAERHNLEIAMVYMSTRARGSGYVGQMGSLLTAAFDQVHDLRERKGMPVILIIDEADSLLTSRATVEQHHEDKSGVNTILQQLDRLRQGQREIAVIAITNRPGVLDPAVTRRAARVVVFERPGDEERRALFDHYLGRLADGGEIDRLVQASAPRAASSGEPAVSLSFSDLTLRALVPILREAICTDQKLDMGAIARRLQELEPTPQMCP